MYPMDQQARIRKIIADTNCTYDQALSADSKSGGNVQKACEIAKQESNELYVGGGSSGLAVEAGPRKHVITSYSNGLMVNDNFHDYSDSKNLKLREMLKNNEFDAETLGVSGTHAEVIYNDRESEAYDNKETIPKTYETNEKRALSFGDSFDIDCPDEIILDEQGDVKFKFMTATSRVLVRMNSEMQVSDFYSEMKKYTNEKVSLAKDGIPISGDCSILVCRQKMFKLVLSK